MNDYYFDFETLEGESIQKQKPYFEQFKDKHKNCPGFYETDSYMGHIMFCDTCDDYIQGN